ncbi:nucleolar protein 58-like [Benincasa hispida]|uniref:nucleolar protein 58-like n=1 Tax=Benincasa hispida TaxID=102211 RepID=UPI001902116A|nr:nucleolar protein 58-like [Benincasa hispida]
MADQASQHSASPSTPSSDQIAMREAAFLVASRRLVAQPHTVPRIAGRTRRNPLAVRPPQFKRGQNTESTSVPTSAVSTERVVNQQLSMVVLEAKVNEEEIERGTLALKTPEVTAKAGTYDGTSKDTMEEVVVEETTVAEVAMDEVTVEMQPEIAKEKKKKKKSKGRKAGEAEFSHPRKEKKNAEKKDDDEDEEEKKEREKKEKEE